MESSQKKQAMIVSLRVLAASAKSTQELEKKLERSGFDPGIIRETIETLQRQGILDDRLYAENLTARLVTAKGSGRRRVSFELARKGVRPELRRQILEKLTPEAEQERAREIGLGRWERLSNLPLDKRRKRVYDFLLRRGYDDSVVRVILEDLRRRTDTERA